MEEGLSMLQITHEGELDLNGFKIQCYVLENGTRVLSGRGMQEALKLVDEEVPPSGQKPGSRLSRLFDYKALQPYIQDSSLSGFEPIVCYKGRQKISGYEATVLADICDVILEARRNGAQFTERQKTIADQCEVLIRGFARVGILALVDEATGYQYDRERQELQKILSAYVSQEILSWEKTFQDSFYREIFRLRKWPFSVHGIKKRPGVVGKYTNTFIYEQLPEGVLEKLKEQTPKGSLGNYKYKFHQSLTPEIGKKHLDNQLLVVTTLMRSSRTWEEFTELFRRQFDDQLELDFGDE